MAKFTKDTITPRGTKKAFAILFPIIMSLAAFVLVMLALFAGTGSQQLQLEPYHIVSMNMSYFGHNLLDTSSTTTSAPTATSTSGGDCDHWWDIGCDSSTTASSTTSAPTATSTSDDHWWDRKRGLGDDISGTLGDIGDDIGDDIDKIKTKLEDELNDMVGDLADDLAAALGISQWYSIHIMNYCEGDFAPNATTPGAWYNTTNCTSRGPGAYFNLTEILSKEIEAGPLSLNPADIPLPDAIQNAVDMINKALKATFVFYAMSSGFSGLTMLGGAVAFVIFFLDKFQGHPIQKWTALANMVIAGLAVLCVGIGSAITTAVAKKGAKEINDAGDDVGISADAGMKFITITWVAFGLMFASLLFWAVSFWAMRAPKKTDDKEKGSNWSGSNHG